MKLKHIVIGGLVVATGIGFAIAASKTNGGKGTGGGETPSTGAKVRYAEASKRSDGKFDAIIYEDGAPIVSIGPWDSKLGAIGAAHDRMRADGVAVYFIFTQNAGDGAWYADGYREGRTASNDMGPFADQALAMQAGTQWVQSQAVPVPAP